MSSVTTPTPTIIDVNISDLFFNTHHDFEPDNEGFFNLEQEAKDFLLSLSNLNVATPEPEDLIFDFLNRV